MNYNLFNLSKPLPSRRRPWTQGGNGVGFSALLLLLGLMLTGWHSVQAQQYWPANITDTDEDGIDDDLEARLIHQYRPIYRYSAGEEYWPSSVSWFARNSQCLRGYNQECRLMPGELLVADPLNALHLDSYLRTQDRELYDYLIGYSPSNPYSSIEYYPYKQGDIKFNLPNEFWPGETVTSGNDVRSRTGIFAQMQRITQPPTYEGRSPLQIGESFMITYFQFFAFNGNPVAIGRHEGDWTYLDVYCATSEPYALKAIVYHHHGDHNGTFDDRVDRLTGSNLPSDGIPVCYLEQLGHEWYPSPGFRTNPYDGQGVSYRVSNVINLGQQIGEMRRDSGSAWDAADTPAVRTERQLALFYNGRWGHDIPDPGDQESPEGPALKSNPGYLPEDDGEERNYLDIERPYYVGYVDAGWQVPDLYTGKSSVNMRGYGSKYFPYRQITHALLRGGKRGVRDWGLVKIKPREYRIDPLSESPVRRLDKAMRLENSGPGLTRLVSRNEKFRWSPSTKYFAEGGNDFGVATTLDVYAEAEGEISAPEDSGKVIVGAGLGTSDGNVRTLAIYVSRILPDGTLGSPSILRFGNEPNAGFEQVRLVGAQEVVVGLGSAISENNFRNLTLWAKRLDPATGRLTGPLHEYVVGSGGAEKRWNANDDVTILTGFGVQADPDNVTRMYWNTGRLRSN